ncbi:MAG: OadG family protein [Epulopiscium sp.]|nr:OadG family protein [Candidatus Epulonipiscium sp.]
MNFLQNTVVVGAQGNAMSDGLATMVIGITVVFAALILLIILLTLSGKFFDSLAAKEEANKKDSKPVVTTKPVEPAVTETSEIDDLELVAVITASIAASMGTSADSLQVRSIKRTNNTWGMSGRSNQLFK